MPTPKLVQRIAWGGLDSPQAGTGNNFVLRLPNKIRTGNTVILIADFAAAQSVTSITDDASNTWSSTPTVAANGGSQKTQVFVLASANSSGARLITVAYSAATSGAHFIVLEYYNSGGVGVTSTSTTAAAPTVSAPALSPSSGSLLIHYAIANAGVIGNGSTSSVTSMTAGSGFTLEAADYAASTSGGSPTMNAYGLQTRTAPGGSVTPSLSTSGTQAFNAVALELTASSGGNAAIPGIHIKRMSWLTNANWNTATWVAPFPCEGSLLCYLEIQGAIQSNPSDNKGNTWVFQVPGVLNSQPAFGWSNATTTGSDLAITFTRGTGGSNTTILIYDIEGADPTSPYVQSTTAGSNTLNSQTVVTDVPSPITPTNANGLIITQVGLGQGPGLSNTSPTGAFFLPITYTGETDFDTFNNADLYAVYYYGSDTSQQHWNWTCTSIASNSTTGTIGVEFKAGPIAPTPPDPNILGITEDYFSSIVVARSSKVGIG